MMTGVPAPPGGTVLERAARGAAEGRHRAGALLHRVTDRRIALALVMEPEVPRERCAAMLLVAQLAASEALAALGPPETESAHRWSGELLVNGAGCGRVEGTMPSEVRGEGGGESPPDWLAVSVTLLRALDDDPGLDPDRTSVNEELGVVDPEALIETVARHWMLWLHRWDTEGMAPVARAWEKRSADRMAPLAGGAYLGLSEAGDLLLAGEGGATATASLLGQWRVS